MMLTAAVGTPALGLLAAMTTIALGAGLTGAGLMGGAIERQRDRAGSATSLFGSLHMGRAAPISTGAVRLVPSPGERSQSSPPSCWRP